MTVEWRMFEDKFVEGGEVVTRLLVRVTWESVEALLGGPHAGTYADDNEIALAVVVSGGPRWVGSRSARRMLTREGWHAIGPDAIKERSA